MATKSKTTTTSTQEATAAEQSFRSYNRVQLAGRLVADPELRSTPSGKSVCRMRLATNDTRDAQFHTVVVWDELAVASKALRKGSSVAVEGRLQHRSWEAADGSTRYATEVVAASVKDLA
jgi:single-strand DNA-binding protein